VETTAAQRVCSLHCCSDNEASDNDDTTLNCVAHEAAVTCCHDNMTLSGAAYEAEVMCYHDNMTLSGAAHEAEVTFPGYIIHGLISAVITRVIYQLYTSYFTCV